MCHAFPFSLGKKCPTKLSIKRSNMLHRRHTYLAIVVSDNIYKEQSITCRYAIYNLDRLCIKFGEI